MRTIVTFRHPADFVPVADNNGILSISGAQWFVSFLGRVPDLHIPKKLCQEDWGVVIFVRRAGKKFWIGLTTLSESSGHTWLAHFHHGSFAWLQRFTASGQNQLQRLVADFHSILTSETVISDVAWYDESEMFKAEASGSPTPI